MAVIVDKQLVHDMQKYYIISIIKAARHMSKGFYRAAWNADAVLR